ncbi:MarR family winged helix-turn-helix transcriptional regulator [Saccharopolyspora griseoalba]|uniref:MarR family winged helix-turn-helix transcriptional regulator n=1 Tax=Saccharopolyspora griseoalba TaxID=1431848 RepID=A0ABW2LN89_9PSEU
MGSTDPVRPAGLGSLGYRLNLAARRARENFERHLHEAGASFAAWTVLETLHVLGPLIQRELAAELRVSGQTVARQVDRLVADGLLRRDQAGADRRAQVVALTDEGRAVHERLIEAARQANAELMRGMEADEVEAFEALLDRMVANLPDGTG